ncbi:unnamed protein product, partial [Gulo gulo]
VLPQRASPWLLFFTALEAHHEGWVCVNGVPPQTWPVLSTLNQWDHGSHIRKTKGLRTVAWMEASKCLENDHIQYPNTPSLIFSKHSTQPPTGTIFTQ